MSDYQKELEELIAIVAQEGASDLHLSVDAHPTIRVAGSLIPVVKKPKLTADQTLGLALAVLNEANKKIFLATKEIDFSFSPDANIRFRGNAFFQKGTVSLALRLIPRQIKTIEDLNLPAKLKDFTEKKQGFFLVVGPMGQGKSTTLAAMIEKINQERAEHILTIEDPVEYLFTNARSIVDQREIRFDTQDFRVGLRSMFRQDVNVGMIGEMRDPDTISTAVTAAETGHLIFSTLHTNSASQTIDRIIDSFPANQQKQIRVQLAGSLLGIFSQRLVPRISGGLIPAYELLITNSAIENLIREGRTAEIDVVLETSAEEGMVTLNASLAELVKRGEITVEDAYRYSLDPRSLERLL
ncbi:MAG: twitching motility protein [Parcubacteria group bacterium GW2011_GWC1_43_11b]|uniref:Type IV pili twitching motility protein PilT n=1 Tax=Candidatus Vogelbacteria bacterium RIFOXYB1_FULL_42_16 TaxID=1802436 RepID=A0A1G2QCQ4_9BACT|nr:MAG: twitching motility protein [Parcubacteria group bacterium GW2011_GWB1_42_9]KKS89426.1 MAG: twitching motility protein [Parcubacteria group bacterium GW2011_GWC1_43_11b]KKT10013.1 MAG: twitching motility protein [Parcubacteria group bacterium GW2011_GWA1_43_21]OHA58365.1 MAG: type IV pili twitching motility protein PilT [Candidatus Vogelbacteria bacterium RIFOXYB1_FULL_42_16]